ncbi:hypothetical protein BDV93DRAFT_612016 [Ceratobasidium sp. AG-I]|nr:hypothetical protein BDV93DRAFT_612016 [Ceratobasidium sp. AG-I]
MVRPRVDFELAGRAKRVCGTTGMHQAFALADQTPAAVVELTYAEASTPWDECHNAKATDSDFHRSLDVEMRRFMMFTMPKYPRVIQIDLSEPEPNVTAQLGDSISQFTLDLKKSGGTSELKVALVEPHTNSPSDELCCGDSEWDGQIGGSKKVRGLDFANMWTVRRPAGQAGHQEGRRQPQLFLTIIPCNHNSSGCDIMNSAAHTFVASPDVVAVVGFVGDLTFNSLTDTPTWSDVEPFKFASQSGFELPPRTCGPRFQTPGG